MIHVLLRWLAALWLAVSLLLPAPAWAEDREPTDEELAAARALFKEAMDLEAADEWEAALGKLEKVGAVKMTPQVRYHIALCHEHLGRLVEAINGFELAEQEARALGDAARAVLENAPERAEKLRARVGHVRLEVSGRVTVSKIFLDGHGVSLALIDTDIPVDPGAHTVEVRRGDEVVVTRDIEIGEGALETVKLAIDDPEQVPEPEPEPEPLPRPRPQPETPPPADPWAQVPAYAVGGAGVAMLVVAGTLYGLRQSTIADVRCEDPEAFTGCDPDDRPTADQARRYDIGSKVMLGVGVTAVAAGGLMWWLLMPDDGAQPSTGKPPGPRVGIGPFGAGLQAVGSF